MSHRLASEPGDAREVALNAALELHQQRPEDDAAVIRTASTIFGWLTGSAEYDPVIIGLTERIASLEVRMSLSETALEDLDVATNEIAAELDELRGEIAATDTALAGRIGSAANRLRGLAADPENPVPPVDPEPV